MPVSKTLYFIGKAPDRREQLHLGGYQAFDQYLTLVMIKNMAEGGSDSEIVMNRKAKSTIWQH